MSCKCPPLFKRQRICEECKNTYARCEVHNPPVTLARKVTIFCCSEACATMAALKYAAAKTNTLNRGNL